MKIYKYTPHIAQFLDGCQLKVTPVDQLNDPFENLITKDALADLEERMGRVFNKKKILQNQWLIV